MKLFLMLLLVAATAFWALVMGDIHNRRLDTILLHHLQPACYAAVNIEDENCRALAATHARLGR